MRVWRLRRITGPDAQERLHPGDACGIQFPRHIGDEQDLVDGDCKCLSDPLVAHRIIFRARSGVEITVEVVREIACRRRREKKTLREDTTRRKDSNVDSRTMPAFKS